MMSCLSEVKNFTYNDKHFRNNQTFTISNSCHAISLVKRGLYKKKRPIDVTCLLFIKSLSKMAQSVGSTQF